MTTFTDCLGSFLYNSVKEEYELVRKKRESIQSAVEIYIDAINAFLGNTNRKVNAPESFLQYC